MTRTRAPAGYRPSCAERSDGPLRAPRRDRAGCLLRRGCARRGSGQPDGDRRDNHLRPGSRSRHRCRSRGSRDPCCAPRPLGCRCAHLRVGPVRPGNPVGVGVGPGLGFRLPPRHAGLRPGRLPGHVADRPRRRSAGHPVGRVTGGLAASRPQLGSVGGCERLHDDRVGRGRRSFADRSSVLAPRRAARSSSRRSTSRRRGRPSSTSGSGSPASCTTSSPTPCR